MGGVEYLAEAATDTLYKMYFGECVWFVKSFQILFLAVEFFFVVVVQRFLPDVDFAVSL